MPPAMDTIIPPKKIAGAFTLPDKNAIVWSVVFIAGLAWLALWYSHQSASAFVHPAYMSGSSLVLPFMGWILMVLAMMLPTTIPLMLLFKRIIAQRHNYFLLQSLLVLGYVVTWSGFGLAFVAGHYWIQQNLAQTFQAYPIGEVIGPGVLVLAGFYQFSSWKSACLTKCRSPLVFLMSRWQGRQAQFEAFRLGLAHGIHCVGCCWLLMLIMTTIGLGHLGVMLGLGLLMTIEKNLRWGNHTRKPVGVLLIGIGMVLLLSEFPLH